MKLVLLSLETLCDRCDVAQVPETNHETGNTMKGVISRVLLPLTAGDDGVAAGRIEPRRDFFRISREVGNSVSQNSQDAAAKTRSA